MMDMECHSIQPAHFRSQHTAQPQVGDHMTNSEDDFVITF